MAQSYRGLTIQIGGDTTKLNAALKSANQAVSSTQSGLRKLSDALKLDPTSLKASQLQVSAFAEHASNAATRMATLNDAMRQVGDQMKVFNGTAQSIRSMADGWDDVSMKAAQTREYYAKLTETIATSYSGLTRLHSEASKVAGESLSKNLADSVKGMDFTKIIDSVKDLREAFGSNGGQLTDMLKTLRSMQTEYDKLSAKAKEYQEVLDTQQETTYVESDINGIQGVLPVLNEEFVEASTNLQATSTRMDELRTKAAELVESLTKFKGVGDVFKFDNKNVDLPSLATALMQIVKAEKMTIEEADEMYDSFEKMKNMFVDAWQNVQTANAVESFTDLEAEAARAEAKVAAVVEQLIRAAKSDATKGIAGLEEKLKSVADAGSSASTRLKQALDIIQNAMKNGGKADEAQMANAMRAYSDAVSAASEKVRILEEEISKLREERSISYFAGMSTEGLVAYAEEAKQDYIEMATAVETYEAALNRVNEELLTIKANNPNDYEDNDQYKEYIQQAEAYNKILRIARIEATSAKEAFTDMSKALTLRDKEHELQAARSELEKMSNINMKVDVDVSALDGLKKALEAMSKETFSADGFSELRENVASAATSMADAEKRYKALNEVAKKDPTNSMVVKMATDALKQAIIATNQHIKAMKKELAAIPSDRVNKAALAAGTAATEYNKAKQKVDDYVKSLRDVNQRIEDLTKERKEISPVTPEAKKRVDELDNALEELKQRRDALAAAGDAAFDSLAIADNTRRIQENGVAIQQDTENVREYKRELMNVGKTDATPKVDDAAFMQVIGRIADAAKRVAGEIVQASNEIDTAYRDMRKTVNGTEREFDNLLDTAVEYSQTHFSSADTILEMQALGGQLGIATENLEKFGTIASNLDIATDIDAETVALKLGQISNILQLDIDGMQGFADALVRLGNNMPAQESAIMAVAQRFGAVAATANFSGEEVLAWSAAIAATGQRSEAAATAISNTVSGIEQAVANGGSDLKQFAAIASMSSDEFVKAWSESPTETLRAFISGLKTLKDSDESAVAALENMGITGVRQQQTLLALTQTIDTLDDALAMSSNAWHNVSDQWGSAGDAAIEAQKKSEGFSGALAIMKNNAQNLAAAMGDGLLPFIQFASDALKLLTDILNMTPAPIKSMAVGLGSLAVAFGTIVPMLKTFATNMSGVFLSLSQTSLLSVALTEIMSFIAGTQLSTAAALDMAAALSGPLMLAFAAVSAAVVFGFNALNEYTEQQETLREATVGLRTATEGLESGYDSYISKTKEVTQSTAEFKDAVWETIEAQATLAEKIRGDWEEVGKNEAQVDALVDRITELAHKTNLTVGEQKELVAAVQTFNNLTGNSVQVLDEQNGELDVSTDQIHKYARSWKDATENETAVSHYGEALAQLRDAEAKLAEAEERNEASDGKWFEDRRDSASSLTEGITNLNAEHDGLVQAVKAAEIALQNEVDKMGDLGTGVKEVEAVLNAAGDSLTNYGNLTDSELRTVVEAYHNTGDASVSELERIQNALNGLKSDAGDAAQIAAELEEAAKTAAKARAEAYKADAKEAYNARKAELDSQYNALKSNLDASYNEQKRYYDSVYNEAKKAYDAEYNQAKKSYDASYNALKKQLDKELSALKKANEKRLKAVKDANDDEVDAFKKATDARLKEMEKEYKAKLKLLELEYGEKDSGIDSQVKALEAETEAEKKAIEERERADKTAELKSAVDKAKSRRKRAEAEKALNDYLQEIEAERNEESRKTEIERLKEQQSALKDELSDRKEQLKAEYDAEVEAYKERRAAELEALQDANQAEYDNLKEKLEAEEEARKEANDTRLENLKEYQTAQLEAMKQAQSDQLEAMKDSQQQQLEAIKAANTAALQEQKAKNTKELQELKAAQDAKYKAIKDGWVEELEGEKSSNANKKAEQDRFISNAELAQKNHLDRLNKLDGEYVTKSERMQAQHQSNLEQGQSQHLDKLKQQDEGSYRARYIVADMFKQDMSEKFFALATDMADAGEKGGSGYKSGYSQGMNGFDDEVASAINTINELFSKSSEGYESGFGLVENMRRGMENARIYLENTVQGVANTIYSYFHHSTPDKGPLRDDDKWGGDLIQNIIDGIRDKEHDLRRQVERMADVVENGFNPSMSLDAAYEAIDTINKGHTSAASLSAGGKASPTVNLTLNMNLSGMSFRDDTDIEKFAELVSQKMAAQTARQIAGRLG